VGQDWEQRIVSELDSKMNEWFDSIPDHRTHAFLLHPVALLACYSVRWDPEQEDLALLDQSAYLYATYYQLQILVHRPFIRARGGVPASFPSLAICTNAARACAKVVYQHFARVGRVMPKGIVRTFVQLRLRSLDVYACPASSIYLGCGAPPQHLEPPHRIHLRSHQRHGGGIQVYDCPESLRRAVSSCCSCLAETLKARLVGGKFQGACGVYASCSSFALRSWYTRDLLAHLASVSEVLLPPQTKKTTRKRDREPEPEQPSDSSVGSPSMYGRAAPFPLPAPALAASQLTLDTAAFDNSSLESALHTGAYGSPSLFEPPALGNPASYTAPGPGTSSYEEGHIFGQPMMLHQGDVATLGPSVDGMGR
jgi:hypothetical protein